MDKKQANDRIFLASANSYSGFVSYFDKIFSPHDFKKIFVLKGGPGTGKSSLMKKASRELFVSGAEVELFYCSSDPKSLDGVIFSKGENRIAIIDGTAPHQTDAQLPGAVDEIIPLGAGFDIEALERNRADIEDLNKKKNIHYKNAYNNLHISSIFDGYIRAEINVLLDLPFLDASVKTSFDECKNAKKGVCKERFFGYFSKYGEGEFDTLYNISDKVISICAEYNISNIFLNALCDYLIKNDIDFIRLPSPLRPADTDAIYITGTKTAFIKNGKSDIKICADVYFKNYLSVKDNEYLREYERQRQKYLSDAKRELCEASDVHFKLEDIYSSNMNFAAVDAVRDELIRRIKKYLSLPT